MRTTRAEPARTARGRLNTGGRPAGFSLLEILLVLMIMGLIVGMVGLSVTSGSRPHRVDAAAREFVDIAEYAMDEAQLSGTDLGVRIDYEDTPEGTVYSYQWLQRAGNTWRLAPFDQDTYGRRELPLNVTVVLEIEEDETELEQRDGERDEGLPPAPQVVFYASGEAVPGLMTWVDAGTGDVFWEMEWDLLGRFEMYQRGIREADDDRG
jgi:type II secretion system protein H